MESFNFMADKLERHTQELAILKAIAEELNRVTDVKSALENSLGLVGELLGLKTGWVWLLDEVTNAPYLAAARALPPYLTQKPERMRGGCHCLTTFLEGDMTGAANVNVLECTRLYKHMEGTEGLQYHASIPLYAHEKQLGVMNVASADWRGLSEEDLQLLYTIGYQIGVAVERARLFDQTVRLATTEERNRLAREIHDTLAQGLAAVALNLESAELLLDDPDPIRQGKARDKIRKALTLTRTNLEEARRSVMDLRATSLQEKPLAEALQALATQFAREQHVRLEFELDPATEPTRRYSARVEATVYRVAQEALTNIEKHAAAQHVKISLAALIVEGREYLRLSVEDNGRGFSTAEMNKPGHFGLIGMNERAKLLGGSLDISSCPGSGVHLELNVPSA